MLFVAVLVFLNKLSTATNCWERKMNISYPNSSLKTEKAKQFYAASQRVL